MRAIIAAAITLACTFGSAWLATIIRSTLPPSHREKESQDVVRLGMGLVATMTALLLGLVTAGAKGAFDSQDGAVRASAANILMLDRHLARYGPETKEVRDLLRRTIAHRIESTWPSSFAARLQPSGFEAGMGGEAIEDQILALTPTNDSQRWFKTQSLILMQDLMRTRWRALGTTEGAVPKAFLIVVVSWLTVTFASFGLFAPRNATVMAVFLIAALSVAAAIFLILELDGPFDGLIRVTGEPMRYALENLGK